MVGLGSDLKQQVLQPYMGHSIIAGIYLMEKDLGGKR